MSAITKEYLNRLYEDMQAEQMKLLNAVKNGQLDEKAVTKQTSHINSILLNTMRLRNTREEKGKNGLPAYMGK